MCVLYMCELEAYSKQPQTVLMSVIDDEIVIFEIAHHEVYDMHMDEDRDDEVDIVDV